MNAVSKIALTVGSLWITTDRVPGDLYLLVGRQIVNVAYVALLVDGRVWVSRFEQRDLDTFSEQIA